MNNSKNQQINIKISLMILLLFFQSFFVKAQQTGDQIIKLSESYELANIILALTDYGQTDEWEVFKNSDYYRELMIYFKPVLKHPLLGKVNYSREKWDSYLSFRTDAYAFQFDQNNQLHRTIRFFANNGLKPFDENLELVNDFVHVSGFRQFYKAHQTYYEDLGKAYLKSQTYPQMLSFLQKEFKQPGLSSAYAIAISPLVCRMNCHRKVGTVATDFITLPDFLLTGKPAGSISDRDLAVGVHMLFTELDHGFVNPATERYGEMVKANFDNSKWDKGSGYEKDFFSTFNEYMTWGLYDLYVETYFPTVAQQVSRDWAIQNETRGFYASTLFNAELKSLYLSRKKGQTITDLYPKLLKRLGEIQKTISQATKLSCNLDNQVIKDTTAVFEIHFSESMAQKNPVEIIHRTSEKNSLKSHIILNRKNNQLQWRENGTVLCFRLNLNKGKVNYLIFNYPWETQFMLKNKKGVNLAYNTYIKTTVE